MGDVVEVKFWDIVEQRTLNPAANVRLLRCVLAI
jgi:hypothetical protein